MKNHLFVMIGFFLFNLLIWTSAVQARSNTLSQVSTINALLSGLYDGSMDMVTLKQQGDFGIGTFDSLDGEMVLYDGIVYRVQADGRAVVVEDAETTPFAAVTTFKADRTLSVSEGMNYETLSAWLARHHEPNYFYAILVEEHFDRVRTRSVPRQREPYRPLVEVVKEQPLFEFQDIDGVLVGFYCPSFVNGINVAGYHLHFLTAEGDGGGHVLDFSVEEGSIQIDTLQRFVLHLPDGPAFSRADLSGNREHELKKVEK